MTDLSVNDETAIARFQEYLRIKTVEPTPEYDKATEFLRSYQQRHPDLFKELNEYGIEGYPVVVMTVPGTEPTLPSLVLNSHTDVVPVFLEHWNHDPWAAVRDEKGDIYARGTQDMKSVGVQYLEALVRLHETGQTPFRRTIHLVFVPDEERGGLKGMKLFVHHKAFQSLNAGLVLDEGLASPDDSFTLYYGERAPWWVHVTATGPTGHGSRFVQNTAMEKLVKVINRGMTFREEQYERLTETPDARLGDVTSLNLTMLRGGVSLDGGKSFSVNVIPQVAECAFDIRITPTMPLAEVTAMLDDWTSEEGVSYTFDNDPIDSNELTPLSDDNQWWQTFRAAAEKLNIKLDPQIFPAATDSRFIRHIGVPALGFSPMNNTPILLHDHNERLNDKVFVRGIEIYCGLLPDLANMAP